jgi:hypothetical protein
LPPRVLPSNPPSLLIEEVRDRRHSLLRAVFLGILIYI